MPDPGLLREAQDPTTPAARLAELAAAAPDLGAEIAANPSAYPELLTWIEQYGDARARATVAARRSGVSSAAPAAIDPFGAPAAAPVDPFGVPAAAAVDPFGASVAAPVSPFGTAVPTTTASGGAKRKKLPLIIAASVVGALVIGGGITAAVVLPRIMPASSPEGATEKLLSAALGLDPLSLAGSLAPSEISALTGSLERLRDVQVDGDDERSVQKAIDRLTAAITVTTDDLEFETDKLADGVERVSIVDGTLEIDGDEDEVIEAFLDLQRVQLQLADVSEGDIDDSLDYQRDSLERSIDLPWEFDFRDVEDATGYPLAVVTVQEGTGWYVSPLMSYADYAYQSSLRYSEPGKLGKRVPDPAPAPDAATAVENTLLAALDRDDRDYWENLAATLPLAERRLVAIYGPAFGDNPWYGAPDSLDINIVSSEFAGAGDGRTVPGDVVVTWDDTDRETSGEIALQEYCADWEVTSRWYDSYWEEWDTSSTRDGGCLDDLPVDLAELGLDEPSLLATQEGGGWLFSPLATLGDWSAIATENLVRLSKDGDLDRLFKNR